MEIELEDQADITKSWTAESVHVTKCGSDQADTNKFGTALPNATETRIIGSASGSGRAEITKCGTAKPTVTGTGKIGT